MTTGVQCKALMNCTLPALLHWDSRKYWKYWSLNSNVHLAP